MSARSGLAEISEKDRTRITQWSLRFEGAKQAAEYAGRRPKRFKLLSLGAEEPLPPGAKRILLVRHGEGHHNAWRAKEFEGDGCLTPSATTSTRCRPYSTTPS